ncbi:MAG: ImmA/IrrE family metallo-endopeptidase [Bacteroidia bacterium]|nr:ImmA/IrrE family metallo-endopeptidase [Bacteroidia bacterium]
MRPKVLTKAPYKAKKLLEYVGLKEITNFPLETLIAGLGAILIEEPLVSCDGRIIHGKHNTIIKVNSEIQYEARKRFTIAHEIGHLQLHKNIPIHNDTSNTLNWFHRTEKKLVKGIQELEANEFATELLMPDKLFYEQAKGEIFSPDLLVSLSNRFKTSITSTIFRYLQFPLHPIFISFISNGIVQYWKKSDDLRVWVKDLNKLPPPSDSVSREYIDFNYGFLYSGREKKQEISKSTWFEISNREEDSIFYEYCIPTKKYKTILSVVWEN